MLSWGKGLVASQVKPDAAEEVREILHAIATTLEHFELIVQAFHSATGPPGDEVVGDFIPPGLQGGEEGVEALQATAFNLSEPGAARADLIL